MYTREIAVYFISGLYLKAFVNIVILFLGFVIFNAFSLCLFRLVFYFLSYLFKDNFSDMVEYYKVYLSREAVSISTYIFVILVFLGVL